MTSWHRSLIGPGQTMATWGLSSGSISSSRGAERGCGSLAGFFVKAMVVEKSKKTIGDGAEFGLGGCVVVRLHRRRMPSLRIVRKPIAMTNSLSSASPRDDSWAPATNSDDHHFHDYRPLVKMCGITTPEDASLAAQAGAMYVGMIMWPHSKRSVRSLGLSREICSAAREFGAEPVGVFVSESASEIERVCDAAGLSFAQLHGDGARASATELSRSLNTIFVMQSDSQGCLQTTITPEQERVVDWVLVDGLEGGSGLSFAWDNFKVPSLCKKKGWLLAGGLNPENVANAISTLRPNAVDVASGIAGSDGIRKDPSRIWAFMQAVRAASGASCVPA